MAIVGGYRQASRSLPSASDLNGGAGNPAQYVRPYGSHPVKQPTGVLQITVELREGGVLRATRTITPGTTIAETGFTLTSAEVSSIVTPDNLEVWISAVGADGFAAVVTDVKLLAPPSTSTATQIEMSGAVSGAGTADSRLDAIFDVRGSSAGVATVAGRLDAIFDVRGGSSGLATLSTILTNLQPLSGSVSGAATVSGTLVAVLPLSGSVSGAGSTSGVLVLLQPLSGSVSGLATLSTVLQKLMPLSGSVSGLATLSTVLQKLMPLTGSVSRVRLYRRSISCCPSNQRQRIRTGYRRWNAGGCPSAQWKCLWSGNRRRDSH